MRPPLVSREAKLGLGRTKDTQVSTKRGERRGEGERQEQRAESERDWREDGSRMEAGWKMTKDMRFEAV